MRLIDADKAITDYSKYGISHPYDAYDLEDILNECQAVEAIPMSIIENIKAEIEEESRFCPLTEGLERALEIIDKYTEEKE